MRISLHRRPKQKSCWDNLFEFSTCREIVCYHVITLHYTYSVYCINFLIQAPSSWCEVGVEEGFDTDSEMIYSGQNFVDPPRAPTAEEAAVNE